MADNGEIKVEDILPTPHQSNAVANPSGEGTATTINHRPTASHALAMSSPEKTGYAQEDHSAEVKDLGWNRPKQAVPEPLVGGLHDNEELWLLVRRFNLQTYHVIETSAPVAGNLDMNVADEDEFSPDKLRSTIERLYMTIGIGLLGLFNHIVRLRSWREQRRTAAFCSAYFVAWAFDFLVPLLSATFITLIVYPPSRDLLFPPAPNALVGSNGAPKIPKAGVLGSHDSVTGAPENHKGEAVEAEAQNFVKSIAHVALASASGKHPMDGSSEGDAQATVPDPSLVAVGASNAQNKTKMTPDSRNPNGATAPQDKTKAPMEATIWNKMRPAMHGLTDVVDTWERFGNALSPTPPFPRDVARLRIAALLVPLFAMSLVVTSYMYMKSVTFGIGFGFFGDPILTPAVQWLNRSFPNWQKLLELRNTVLKGVPTNAQLTITLLRIGEANKSPIPPPPHALDAPPNAPARPDSTELAGTGGDAPLGASPAQLELAAAAIGVVGDQKGSGEDIEKSKAASHGKGGRKFLRAIQDSVAATVHTAIGADKVKASVGSIPSKERLGAIPSRREALISGPIDFKARYDGKKGHVYIATKATIPCVSFTTDSTVERIGSQDREDLHPIWTVAIADIKELKKIGGFGWKTKIVVGWALEREIADGLEIVEKSGKKWKVTALPLRDELFNRLVAMGGQKWEAW